VLLLLLAVSNLNAKNILVSNISLTGPNTANDYTLVQFNISQENSCRSNPSPGNWYAARVFVMRLMGISDLQHTLLSNTVLSEKDLCVHSKKAQNL
jgi:hypothetical protein